MLKNACDFVKGCVRINLIGVVLKKSLFKVIKVIFGKRFCR